jgi:hypothetical protein
MGQQNELMLPTFEKVIDGETYEIRMLDGVVGFRLYTRLLTCAGGALQALGKIDAEGDRTELAARAIGALLASLPQDLYEEARGLFADNTTVFKASGQKPRLKNVFGLHFAGRYAHLTKWMVECFRVNFADFLDEGGPLSSLIGLAAKASQSPTASTGSPSGS